MVAEPQGQGCVDPVVLVGPGAATTVPVDSANFERDVRTICCRFAYVSPTCGLANGNGQRGRGVPSRCLERSLPGQPPFNGGREPPDKGTEGNSIGFLPQHGPHPRLDQTPAQGPVLASITRRTVAQWESAATSEAASSPDASFACGLRTARPLRDDLRSLPLPHRNPPIGREGRPTDYSRPTLPLARGPRRPPPDNPAVD